MLVSNYLKDKFCVMDLKSEKKEDALREIAAKLAQGNEPFDQEKFIKDVLERENLGSTGIGNSVAIPHARTEAVKGFVIGFGRSKPGIEFDSLDGKKVNLIFLMGADPAELNLYLRILAELSKLLMNAAFRQVLISAENPQKVIETVKKFEQS